MAVAARRVDFSRRTCWSTPVPSNVGANCTIVANSIVQWLAAPDPGSTLTHTVLCSENQPLMNLT